MRTRRQRNPDEPQMTRRLSARALGIGAAALAAGYLLLSVRKSSALTIDDQAAIDAAIADLRRRKGDIFYNSQITGHQVVTGICWASGSLDSYYPDAQLDPFGPCRSGAMGGRILLQWSGQPFEYRYEYGKPAVFFGEGATDPTPLQNPGPPADFDAWISDPHAADAFVVRPSITLPDWWRGAVKDFVHRFPMPKSSMRKLAIVDRPSILDESLTYQVTGIAQVNDGSQTFRVTPIQAITIYVESSAANAYYVGFGTAFFHYFGSRPPNLPVIDLTSPHIAEVIGSTLSAIGSNFLAPNGDISPQLLAALLDYDHRYYPNWSRIDIAYTSESCFTADLRAGCVTGCQARGNMMWFKMLSSVLAIYLIDKNEPRYRLIGSTMTWVSC